MKTLFQKHKDLTTGKDTIEKVIMDDATYVALKTAGVELFEEKSNEALAYVAAVIEQEKAYLAALTPSELKARELQQADPKGWALAQREQAAAKSVEMYNAQKTVKPNKK